MGGEEELNREIHNFGRKKKAYKQHVVDRCFAKHSNDPHAFHKCYSEDYGRFKKSIESREIVLSFAIAKFETCKASSKDPGSCYLEVHRFLKDKLSTMFNAGTVGYPAYGHN